MPTAAQRLGGELLDFISTREVTPYPAFEEFEIEAVAKAMDADDTDLLNVYGWYLREWLPDGCLLSLGKLERRVKTLRERGYVPAAPHFTIAGMKASWKLYEMTLEEDYQGDGGYEMYAEALLHPDDFDMIVDIVFTRGVSRWSDIKLMLDEFRSSSPPLSVGIL